MGSGSVGTGHCQYPDRPQGNSPNAHAHCNCALPRSLPWPKASWGQNLMRKAASDAGGALAEHAGGVEEHLWVDTHVPEGVVARPERHSPRARIGGTFVLDRDLLCKSQRKRAQLRWRVQSARTERGRAVRASERGASTWARRCGSLVPGTRRAVGTRRYSSTSVL